MSEKEKVKDMKVAVSGKISRFFISNPITPLLIIAALLLGIFALVNVPKEEEPQIKAPLIDIIVPAPGGKAEDVVDKVSRPLEKLIWEIPGVEYVYSASYDNFSLITVRFYVGSNDEESIVKVYNKVFSNMDKFASKKYSMRPLIKFKSIDDVPFLAFTLWSEKHSPYELRRIGVQLKEEISKIVNVTETKVIGGDRRKVRVILDPQQVAAYKLDPNMVVQTIQDAGKIMPSGSIQQNNEEIIVKTGSLFRNTEEVKSLVLTFMNNRPIYLRDVATITDGPEDPVNYVTFMPGPAMENNSTGKGSNPPITGYPAVTLSISKKKGSNATELADVVINKISKLQGSIIPDDVKVQVTRNYGKTAKDKTDSLLQNMLLAVVSVILIIAVFLGMRASLMVAISIPVIISISLFAFYALGYTINRITLFALIFSIGVMVDDGIVITENIIRHLKLRRNQHRNKLVVVIEGVNEVGGAIFVATFVFIAAVLPMGLVKGLMGPYMRPIPVLSAIAMFTSLFVALIINPWVAYLAYRNKKISEDELCSDDECEILSEGNDKLSFYYKKVLDFVVHHPAGKITFFLLVGLLWVGSVSLLPLKVTKIKMLPFDNKTEFQIIVDMPEGTTLEDTASVVYDTGQILQDVPEVDNYQMYVGTASPYNFNGLVRKYYMRSSPNVGDIQVNLTPKDKRKAKSHEIAKRVRNMIAKKIGNRNGANIKVAEVPPGPPVLQTIVCEVYGPDYDQQLELAKQIKDIFKETPGLVDVDWIVEDPQKLITFKPDHRKIALMGIDNKQVIYALRMAIGGIPAANYCPSGEKEDIPIVARFSRKDRSDIESLKGIRLLSKTGSQVPLEELVNIEEEKVSTGIQNKNLKRVVYVTADMAGAEESPIYAIFDLQRKINNLKPPDGGDYKIKQLSTRQPKLTDKFAIKWDGEWHISYEVFRDLGAAFSLVLILIYVILVYYFKSFVTPIVIMLPIPLMLIGVIPGHKLFGAYFTATSMIGIIAEAGILVIDATVIVDFIEDLRRKGRKLGDAVTEGGAVRFRPTLLTSLAIISGSIFMLSDPIFKGMAIAMMFSEMTSITISRVAVPIFYSIFHKGRKLPGEDD